MAGGPIRFLTPTTATTVTGNANTKTAGSVIPGTTFNRNELTQGSACVLATVLADTNTFTFTGVWQVSLDNTTFYDCALANNPANVALDTGTASADVAVTKVIEAPSCVYSFPFFRFALVTGVVTGAAIDTYSLANYAVKRTVYSNL